MKAALTLMFVLAAASGFTANFGRPFVDEKSDKKAMVVKIPWPNPFGNILMYSFREESSLVADGKKEFFESVYIRPYSGPSLYLERPLCQKVNYVKQEETILLYDLPDENYRRQNSELIEKYDAKFDEIKRELAVRELLAEYFLKTKCFI